MNMMFHTALLTFSRMTLMTALVGKNEPPKTHTRYFEEFIKAGKTEQAAFKSLINGTKPVVVKFTTDNCGPCKATVQDFEALAAKYQDQAIFVVVNGNSNIGVTYKVLSVPTFMIFNKGEKIINFKRAGLNNQDWIQTIETYLKKLAA